MLTLAGVPSVLLAAASGEERIPFVDEDEFVADVRSSDPTLKYYDFRKLAEAVTPTGEFFIFHQTKTMALDAARWRLHVGGLVERPQSFSLVELTQSGLPALESEVTIECAGNTPRKDSLNGQVGNARWSGVSLAALLQHCGIKAEAREIVFFGADEVRDPSGVSRGPHGRSIFVQDTLAPEGILATAMNGEVLRAAHGFPLRLILPGWYGMAQIKWLTRIEVLDRRYEGFHMSRNYQTLHVTPDREGEARFLPTSISRTRIKSVIAKVVRHRDRASAALRIVGAAWGGTQPINKVEVRIDDGPWRPARIDQRRGTFAWQLWSYDWSDGLSGRHVLCSRAIDAAGNVQPTLAEWNREIRSAREHNAQWERTIHLPS